MYVGVGGVLGVGVQCVNVCVAQLLSMLVGLTLCLVSIQLSSLNKVK